MSTRVGVMWLVSLCLHAQGFFNGSGVIRTRAGVDPSQFSVELPNGQRVEVGDNGRFETGSLPSGSHILRVVDQQGTVVGVTNVSPFNASGIEVNIAAGVARKPLGVARAVSVESLRADPDGKAEREFRHALWDANTNDFKNAAKHFAKALQIDERHTPAAANWAAMEIKRGDAVQAEAVARRGLVHAPGNARLLHALGISLLAQRQLTDEAVQALRGAAVEFPKLLLTAAQTEYLRGNRSQTRELAEAYLQSGEKEFREVAGKLKAVPDIAP